MPPIDPLSGPRFALRGRVVTMNSARTVLGGATVYVEDGRIAALVRAGGNVPDTLQDVPVFDTKGTIYPGLIDLHNHLSYNVLPLWRVPEPFANRDRWSGTYPAYRKLVSGPMQVLGKTPGYVEAI